MNHGLRFYERTYYLSAKVYITGPFIHWIIEKLSMILIFFFQMRVKKWNFLVSVNSFHRFIFVNNWRIINDSVDPLTVIFFWFETLSLQWILWVDPSTKKRLMKKLGRSDKTRLHIMWLCLLLKSHQLSIIIKSQITSIVNTFTR